MNNPDFDIFNNDPNFFTIIKIYPNGDDGVFIKHESDRENIIETLLSNCFKRYSLAKCTFKTFFQ